MIYDYSPAGPVFFRPDPDHFLFLRNPSRPGPIETFVRDFEKKCYSQGIECLWALKTLK